MSEIHIKINGQEKPWSQSFITPKDILELGNKQEPYNVYIIFKIQHGKKEEVWNGVEKDLHKNIKIEDEDAFDIEDKFQDLKNPLYC